MRSNSYVSPRNEKYIPGTPQKATFDTLNLRKLHLQLRHGSFTAMKYFLKATGMCKEELSKNITELLKKCPCVQAQSPLPHPIVSRTPPSIENQTDLGVDLIFLDGVPCLHVVCRTTSWSETAVLKYRVLKYQAETFLRIQVYRHGKPKIVHCDNEFSKEDFRNFCENLGIKLPPISTNDYEANGSIASSNRVLRMFYRRLRSDNRKGTLSDIFAEATFGKNINEGKN